MTRLYRWFWEDLLRNGEPYTDQFVRISEAHPLFWHGTIGTLIGLCIVGISFLIWLLFHVKEYREKK